MRPNTDADWELGNFFTLETYRKPGYPVIFGRPAERLFDYSLLTTRPGVRKEKTIQKVLSMKLFGTNPQEMLEFCKKVLVNVSFDRKLFKKELLKAIHRVGKEEIVLLKTWCIAKFGHIYGDVIAESFRSVTA
jgi:hypothetical protein